MGRAQNGDARAGVIIGILAFTCAAALAYWWITSSPPQAAATPPSPNHEVPPMRNQPSAANTPWSQFGPSGGRLTVQNDFANGASVVVDIPPQALDAPDELRVLPVEISWRPRTGHWLGVSVLVESKSGQRQFRHPLTLTLHLPPADMVGGAFPVGYRWEPETGEVEPIDPGRLDPTAGTAAFTTFRPGIYTWVLVFP